MEHIIEHNLGTYKGNPLLKKMNQNIDWTEHMVSEYIKCSEDPVYFINNYMKIINLDEGLISFKLYDYQIEMVESFKNNRNTFCVLSRQSGKSSTTCGFILWYVIFNEDKLVALMANKGDTAREILGRVQLAYQHLPKWLQQGVGESNKGSMLLENRSRVIAAATSASAIRGYSVNLLYIDELSFVENWDEFYTSVFPTITSGKDTKIIFTTTPRGLNHADSFWVNAIEGRNGFNPIMVRWDRVPGRDEKWKQQTLAGMNFDLEKFSQEMECVSGDTVVTIRDKETKKVETLTIEELSIRCEFLGV